jgi:hypothetical protein
MNKESTDERGLVVTREYYANLCYNGHVTNNYITLYHMEWFVVV